MILIFFDHKVSIPNGLLFGLVSCLLIVLLFIFRHYPDGRLRIVFCDVGQGDATLISYKDVQILIDTGPSNTAAMSCLRHRRPFWDTQIEAVILTHIHNDHVGGLGAVLERFNVGHIWVDPSQFEFPLTEQGLSKSDLETMISSSGGLTVMHAASPNIRYGDLALTSLPLGRVQASNSHDPVNELAIVPIIRFNDFSVLIPSDIGFPREAALLRSGVLTPVDVMKIPHHGSKYSSSKPFVTALHPSIAIVSVGSNSFGHPNPQALAHYQALGIPVLSTKDCGDVRLSSNGHRMWLETQCQNDRFEKEIQKAN